MLKEIGDVIAAYEEGAKQRHAPDVLWPPPKRTIEVPKLRPTSLPATMKQCHCWVFARADRCRRNVLALDGETLIGLGLR